MGGWGRGAFTFRVSPISIQTFLVGKDFARIQWSRGVIVVGLAPIESGLTCDSDSARCRIRTGSGLLVPVTELNELFTLLGGVGDWTAPPSRSFSPLVRPGGLSDVVPSDVWIFLAAGGSPAPCWFFFDLNRKAIVEERSWTVVTGVESWCY